jgi:hypothetical protein
MQKHDRDLDEYKCTIPPASRTMYLVPTGIFAIEVLPPEMAVWTDKWRQNIDAASGSSAIVNLFVTSPA